MTKLKNPEQKGSSRPAGPLPPAPASEVAPLFRRIDWLALGIAFGVVWIIYVLTLAPELTLRDSGELVTGSFYAGIPHAPGYPVWTMYSWLWTALVPFGNMAWRVALAEAFAGAAACGLIALLVSRGSSLLMEGIEELGTMTGKWESAICLVAGLVAGLLVGFDGFMWRESVAVNRIAVSSVPVFLLMLVFLMRWIYAPHQLRYAYWAAFIFGICYTTHQSLIVAALGFEVTMVAGNPRLGRDVFVGNFILYTFYYLVLWNTGQHLFHNIGAKPGLWFLFNLVGIGSLVAWVWLTVRTRSLGTEWLPVLTMFGLWWLGVAFYLYMPIAGMTNPPMQWAYPRTVDGFWHALTRGQYEQPNPTNLLADPGRFLGQLWNLVSGIAEEFNWVYMFVALVPFAFFLKMQARERAWLRSLAAMYFCLGVLMMILMNPNTDLASAELIRVFFNSSHTIVACLIGYGLALIAAFMATHYERFRRSGLVGGLAALGLALYCLWETTGKHYFGTAGKVSIADLPHWIAQAFGRHQYGLPIFGSLVLVAIACGFAVAMAAYRERAPLLITLGLFAAMPLPSVMSHWFDSDQRGHWFGYWFGHDMFTPPFHSADGKPIYPEMTRNAVLFGGTDPGRFCPTYMIFCESFTPHPCQPAEDRKFDRRDVYIITQNALADPPYLNYIRAHYHRSAQLDPPFFQELARTLLRDKEYETNFLARAARPLDRFFTQLGDQIEERRRTFSSWFKEEDFINLPSLQARLKAGPQQDAVSRYVYANLSPATQGLLSGQEAGPALRRGLVRDLNRLLQRGLEVKKQRAAKQEEKTRAEQAIAEGDHSASLAPRQAQLTKEIAELDLSEPLYEPRRFQQVPLTEYLADFIRENPQSHTRIRLNRLLLEAAYPQEIAPSLGGVYPDREIYTPSAEDGRHCFEAYMMDAQRRLRLGQLKPGEDVKVVDNQVLIAGQVAIMAINGLIAKVIFDRNPKNEFFVEESMALDWMYPHLTPYGIIMKVNRRPLASIPEDVLQKDHTFWKQYSKRMTGDFIDYGTPVKTVADWIEKTYLRRDLNGFTGDRKFVHDSDAQKSFSKLRSSIAGVYAWRLQPQCPAEYRPKSESELQSLRREAEFAFLQAFALCPYSPEAVNGYINLLLQSSRVGDAVLVVETCLKFDPFNGWLIGTLDHLKGFRDQEAGIERARKNLGQLQEQVRTNPANLQAAFDLAGAYLSMQQTGAAVQVLDGVVSNPQAPARAVLLAAQFFGGLNDWARIEVTLQRLVVVDPANPEAWYDLAAIKANLRKPAEAMPALKRALELGAERLKHDPKARDLVAQARQDLRFSLLRENAEFQKLVPP